MVESYKGNFSVMASQCHDRTLSSGTLFPRGADAWQVLPPGTGFLCHLAYLRPKENYCSDFYYADLFIQSLLFLQYDTLCRLITGVLIITFFDATWGNEQIYN